jgi:hypothetical protein
LTKVNRVVKTASRYHSAMSHAATSALRIVVAALVELTAFAAQAEAPPSSMARISVPFVAAGSCDDPHIAYAAAVRDGTLFVTRDGMLVYGLRDGGRLTETLPGARLSPRGAVRSATRVSRFLGNDSACWQRDAAAFERVSLGEAWPGVTVELAAHGGDVEKLFTVAPGADVRRIAVRLRGARHLTLSADGGLVADTGRGNVRFTAPRAWQDIAGERRLVRVGYTLAGDRYGFTLGSYERDHPVVIDPILQATYLGGSGGDIAYAVAVDATGSVFVAGSTASQNFPGTAGGARPSAGGGGDAFVAKLDSTLTSLLQATYLGGASADIAYALAIDGDGNVYVAGSTASADFPGTAGGAQTSAGGGGDAFVAWLSGDLTDLKQATYLGGNGFDQAFALAIGGDSDVFVAGGTASANFPGTAGAAQPARAGSGDAFVARLDRTLAKLLRATYLGGSNNETAFALARGADGSIYVAGSTGSANFPGVAGGAQATFGGGGGDAFVARLDRTLATLMQSTYLGGSLSDIAYAIAVASDGGVFVAGETASTNFPSTSGGFQPQPSVGLDAFVAKLTPNLTALTQATYLGGLGDDTAAALSLDATGKVYVAGSTRSSVFPGTAGGAQPDPGGNGDAFVAELDAALATLVQSTFYGGSGLDQGRAIALDTRGKVYVAGGTASFNLPGASGGAQASTGGNGDGFVVRMTASLRLVDPPAIEYYHAEWNHYFVTANSDEIAKLDAGVFAGWARTGQSFKVLPLDAPGAANMCRFFSVSFAPKSSHFYTPYAGECASVKQNPDWQFEAEVFAVYLPDAAGGCPTGTLALYRLYNDGQGGAPNHRFTTSAVTRADMLAQGWISEGTGALGVTACVPA